MAPFSFLPHELFTQVLGETQSVSLVQVFIQTLFLQMNAPQLITAGVTQAPSPSQVEAKTSEVAVEHASSLHLLPLATYVHAPPLQSPVVPHVADAVTLHFSCGSGELSATVVQSPREAERLHAMHAPVQSELQHVPCAQWFDWHSLARVHSAPGGLSPHEELIQKLPDTQSLSFEQTVKQLGPLQMNGLHVSDGGATHWPD